MRRTFIPELFTIRPRDGPAWPEELEKDAATVEGRTLTVTADTTDDDSVRAMVDHVVGELGGVDVLVNAPPRAR